MIFLLVFASADLSQVIAAHAIDAGSYSARIKSMTFNWIGAAHQPDLQSVPHPAARVSNDQHGQREKNDARSDYHGDGESYPSPAVDATRILKPDKATGEFRTEELKKMHSMEDIPHSLSLVARSVKHCRVSESIPVGNDPPSLPGPSATREVPRWRWWVHLLLIGAYPLTIVAVGSLRDAGQGPALTGSVAGLLRVAGIELLVFSLIFAVGWLASRATREELLLRWRPGIWVVPLGLGYSVGIRLATGLLIVIVSTVVIALGLATPQTLQQFFTDNRPQIESLVDIELLRNNPAYYWLSLTLVSFVVAGLREELWRTAVLAAMRKLWPRAFGTLGGQFVAVALIAAVFGAAHANQGIIGAVMAGTLGLLLGVIMVWHRSIWPAVLAHGLFDATSMALLPFAMEKLQKIAQ